MALEHDPERECLYPLVIEKRNALQSEERYPLLLDHETDVYPPMILPVLSFMIVTEAPRPSQRLWKVLAVPPCSCLL